MKPGGPGSTRFANTSEIAIWGFGGHVQHVLAIKQHLNLSTMCQTCLQTRLFLITTPKMFLKTFCCAKLARTLFKNWLPTDARPGAPEVGAATSNRKDPCSRTDQRSKCFGWLRDRVGNRIGQPRVGPTGFFSGPHNSVRQMLT